MCARVNQSVGKQEARVETLQYLQTHTMLLMLLLPCLLVLQCAKYRVEGGGALDGRAATDLLASVAAPPKPAGSEERGSPDGARASERRHAIDGTSVCAHESTPARASADSRFMRCLE